MAKSPPPSTSDQPPSTRTCLCSPTSHPGSFRCSLHRVSRLNFPFSPPRSSFTVARSTAYSVNSQGIRRSNLVRRMSAKEVNCLIRSYLMQLIRPSSHDLRRRRKFVARPSRFR